MDVKQTPIITCVREEHGLEGLIGFTNYHHVCVSVRVYPIMTHPQVYTHIYTRTLGLHDGALHGDGHDGQLHHRRDEEEGDGERDERVDEARAGAVLQEVLQVEEEAQHDARPEEAAEGHAEGRDGDGVARDVVPPPAELRARHGRWFLVGRGDDVGCVG